MKWFIVKYDESREGQFITIISVHKSFQKAENSIKQYNNSKLAEGKWWYCKEYYIIKQGDEFRTDLVSMNDHDSCNDEELEKIN